MRINTKRIIMIIFLLLGTVLNCLCYFNIIPLGYFSFSAVLIAGYSLVIIYLPILFPGIAKADEKSKHISELEHKEKQLLWVMAGLICAWAGSMIACIVYSL